MMMKILTLKYDIVYLDRIVFVLEDIDCSLGIPSLLETRMKVKALFAFWVWSFREELTKPF